MSKSPPEVEVEESPDGIHLIFINGCPYCGKKHFHGVGGGLGPDGTYGHRVSHCPDPYAMASNKRGYILVPALAGKNQGKEPHNSRRSVRENRAGEREAL